MKSMSTQPFSHCKTHPFSARILQLYCLHNINKAKSMLKPLQILCAYGNIAFAIQNP